MGISSKNLGQTSAGLRGSNLRYALGSCQCGVRRGRYKELGGA